MAGVENEHFVIIEGWMSKELKLKGSELILYAIIYKYSKSKDKAYRKGLRCLEEWTGCTKQGVMNALKKLIEKGLIAKTVRYEKSVRYCDYYIVKGA